VWFSFFTGLAQVRLVQADGRKYNGRQADRCAHNAQDQAGQTECTAADFVCHKKALLIIVGLVVSGFYLFCVVISF